MSELAPLSRTRSPRGASIAFVTALASILTLLVWSAIDASFDTAVWQAKVSFRLQDIPSRNPQMLKETGILDAMLKLHWDAIGKRILVLAIIIGAGAVATICLLWFAVSQGTARQKWRAIIILAGWQFLYMMSPFVTQWRTHHQVLQLMPRLEQVAGTLQQRWPTTHSEILPGLEVFTYPQRRPNWLLRRDFEWHPWQEDIGLEIERLPNGVFRFDLSGSSSFDVEFHSHGSIPAGYFNEWGDERVVARAISLKENWYLVRYRRRVSND